jgi:hypothetical protein
MRTLVIAGAIEPALLGLPSCGRGSADSGSTASTVVVQQTPSLTKPRFIVQADSICRAANEKGAVLTFPWVT